MAVMLHLLLVGKASRTNERTRAARLPLSPSPCHRAAMQHESEQTVPFMCVTQAEAPGKAGAKAMARKNSGIAAHVSTLKQKKGKYLQSYY